MLRRDLIVFLRKLNVNAVRILLYWLIIYKDEKKHSKLDFNFQNKLEKTLTI